MTDRQLLFAELLDRLRLQVAAEAQERLLWFLAELLRWNHKVNLTAITDPMEAIEKHLIDSLTVLPHIQGSERLLDIGSGGGFPGLPLKLARPQLQLVSIDAVGKKISFQRHIGRQLQLTDFLPIATRIEALLEQAEFCTAFDVIVSRAFASLADFARVSLPLLADKGYLLAMKGGEGENELRESTAKLHALGLTRSEIHTLRLPSSGAVRTLILLRQ